MGIRVFFIYLMAVCCQFAIFADDDAESRHIKALLFNGDSIEGYLRSDLKTGLKNMFSKSGTIRQYINVGVEPKGGDTRRYSASEIKEYRFVETSKGYPEGFAVVSEKINSPAPFKPNTCVRGFAGELYRGENGSILKWNVWESSGGRNVKSRVVPVIGVKFKGAKAAYGLITNGGVSLGLLRNYLKKRAPVFKKIIEDYYYNCENHKAHFWELRDNPSSILRLYDEYVKTYGPINDPDALSM